MSDEIYVVTSGDYSDYRIVGVFTDKELAEKAQAMSIGEIETFEVNPARDRLNQGLRPWIVHYHQGSGEFRAYQGSDLTLKTTKHSIFEGWAAGTGSITVECWAEDEQHACKIASEVRAQLVATNQWPPKPTNEEALKWRDDVDSSHMSFTGLASIAVTTTFNFKG